MSEEIREDEQSLPTTACSAIDDILDRFDWEKVQNYMLHVNWTWHIPNSDNDKEVPSFSRLRRCAKGLLTDVASGKYDCVETGGFRAYRTADELRLDFLLTHAEEGDVFSQNKEHGGLSADADS